MEVGNKFSNKSRRSKSEQARSETATWQPSSMTQREMRVATNDKRKDGTLVGSKALAISIDSSNSTPLNDASVSEGESLTAPLRTNPRLNRSQSSNILSTAVYVKDDTFGWRPAELLSRTTENATLPDMASVILTSDPALEYTDKYYKGKRSSRSKAKMAYGSVRSVSSLSSEKRVHSPPWLYQGSQFEARSPDSVISPCSSFSSLDDSLDDSSVHSAPQSPVAGDTITTDTGKPVTVDLKNYETGGLPLQDLDEDGDLVVRDDLGDIPFLHEASILFNLAARHELGMPYTRAGVVVIAMNPFKWIEGLYSVEKRKEYADRYMWKPEDPLSSSASKPIPHAYEASALAYRGLVVDGTDQSILVSGETGAGKTESVKILMAHLATFDLTKPTEEEIAPPPPSVFHTPAEARKGKERGFRPRAKLRSMSHLIFKQKRNSTSEMPAAIPEETVTESDVVPCREEKRRSSSRYLGKMMETNSIVQRVIDSNPLLEAFGNAKTSRNDNSSRFSKYTKLQFDLRFVGGATPSCTLAGSTCQTFLLEKSRVVNHESGHGERTFHVFYQLLAAPEEYKSSLWGGLSGTDASSFKYVGNPSTDVIEGMTDADRWDEVYDALNLVGVSGEKLFDLMRALCVILQLGNIVFSVDPGNEEGSVISSTDELEKLSDILGVSGDDIASCLTFRTIVTTRDTFKVPLNPANAKDTCDALAKAVYSSTFDWLVQAINDATCAEKNYEEEPRPAKFGTIGLLDIFGFESFDLNQFEQLCINHANERLQQRFTEDIFRSVHDEYKSEGIALCEVKFEDNSNIIKLFEGRLGLIDILNEECLRPQGSDTGFVNKIYRNNNNFNSPLFTKRSFQRHEFGIRHYAGRVKYDASKIVTKNTDALPHDVVVCAAQSTNPLVAAEFKPRAEEMKMARNTLVHETVWTKFRTQLGSLMDDISKTNTRYVRCIVPNREKKALVTDLRYTVAQLHYAGILSAVNFSRAAFPNRMELQTFLERFAFLRSAHGNVEKGNDTIKKDTRESVSDLLGTLFDRSILGDDDEEKSPFVTGKSRVYFRSGVLESLEARRLLAFEIMATKIQCLVRRRKAIEIFRQLWMEHEREIQMLKSQNVQHGRPVRRRSALKRMRQKLSIIGYFLRRRRN